MTTAVRPAAVNGTFALALALALALGTPVVAQTRPPPDGERSLGPFHLEDGRLVGSHVSFGFDREHGRIVEYTVDGRLLFESIALTPSAVRIVPDPDAHALGVGGRGFGLRIFDGPGGAILFVSHEDVLATLTLDPASDLSVTREGERALVLADADGPVVLIESRDHRVSDAGTITIAHRGALRLAEADHPLPPPPGVRERIDDAFERGRLGAEVTVERLGREGLVSAYDNITVSVDAQEGRLRAVVTAPDATGRTLIFHVADAVLAGASLRVTLEGQEIGEAEDELDALNPDDDGLAPEWYALEGEAGVTVFLSLPHFSEWDIEIQSIQQVAARAFPILGAAGAIAIVVLAAFLMVRGGKRDEL